MGNYSIMSCLSASNSSPDILLLERTLSLDCIDLTDLYFELSGTNMLLKKQIIHIIYNELTASGKQGSSNVNDMFCALEYKFQFIQKF